ncbi:Hypothetical protein DEACI_1996 [Acididesulfobacillus acetoxydans]|uniref:Uncharacterized protein n=1 Tax=Acididesulfobacillus acetoxydans TaxID=1561005 RepID=A0A8S0X536_9FIRM|nr:Hypothetical protein DEACI_1996 [Acididesulfobacillus acetoxydans]CEJ09362.1 Hypothetical protein DEACI_3846 [Acididesulfobacillus acetoxydans]
MMGVEYMMQTQCFMIMRMRQHTLRGVVQHVQARSGGKKWG